MIEYILLAALVVLAIVNIVLITRKREDGTGRLEASLGKVHDNLEHTEKTIRDEFQRNRVESNQVAQTNREELSAALARFGDLLTGNVKASDDLLRGRFKDFAEQQRELNSQITESIKTVNQTVESRLEAIRDDNTRQLNEMRRTVDEKLQTTLEKRLGESFRQVSERLEQVHKGLGEMQSIAAGVGDLKKVLSNVKTRGIMGEYQLENILEQLLAPHQYAKNVATRPGSRANVEFAIKLPGKADDKIVWLPIDSKFPIEDYEALLDAYDAGDKPLIEAGRKRLGAKLDDFAKTIHEKYIEPPHTTDFGIMFLPVEGLYAEVLRIPGIFEGLQRKYKITVTGPTTLAALLNSLQMGFRTLAVQKRGSEVWEVLKGVKLEFANFTKVLAQVRKQLNTASGTLEKLQTTRTNQINRKLSKIETLDRDDSVVPLLAATDKEDGDGLSTAAE